MYETIIVQKENGVATVTLNCPAAMNAMTPTTFHELRVAVEALSGDAAVRVVVITGAGRHFSSGGDIRRFKERIEAGGSIESDNVIEAGAMTNAIRLCPKPVVAMINGAAVGAGCSLALACDFRVMTAQSKLGMAFINMGLSGDTGGIYFLERIVGLAKTTEMMALGTPVGGEEAHRLGLATRLAPDGELETVTAELVAALLAKPTQAIARQKKLYYEFFLRDLQQFTYREADFMGETSLTFDHKEAVYAFLEKRRPEFKGN